MADIEWEDVEALYEAARARPAAEREAFLEAACDDPAVRREVASLLEAREEATGFFGELADAVGGSTLHRPDPEATGQQSADPLDIEGTQVGRYAVEAHLGSGGMGVVYRARDPQLDRPVVLKFLPPHLSAHPEAEGRFVREAKAASVLEHSNIATIYETGQAEDGAAEGQRFIAMAYYEGETLREKLNREGPLSVGEAVHYAQQIAAGLARAHEAGIVHRDVKPANVMVTEAGEVKLLDFGLAKAAAETRLTEPGQRLGTAAYMSPEQAEGKEVDGRTDLWALGAMLYEMLTGKRPFQGERPSAVVHAILHGAPTPLSEQRETVSPTLEQVVDRCLQKEPEKRYSSARGLLTDLRRLQSEVRSTDDRQIAGQDEGGSAGGPLSWLWWFARELRRRRVLRAAAVYAGTGFVIVQLGEILMEPLGVPGSTLRMVAFLLALGFPLAVGLAWTFDVTEEGLVRTRPRAPTMKGAADGKPFTSNGLIVALLVASIGLFLYPRVFPSEDGPVSAGGAAGGAEVPDRSVAVLPFEVSGAGLETWRDGMVTALSLNLDGAAGLRAIADRTVFATLEDHGLSEEGLDIREALEVARAVGSRYAIVGSALQMGGDLRLSTEIRRTASGERLGTAHVSGSPDSAMVLANELARKVLGVLLEKSEERIPSVDLASITTKSLDALTDFLDGERHLRAGEYEAAATDFEAAVRRDSSFALAYARLWSVRQWTGPLSQADQMLRRAYERSNRLPRRERRIVRIKHLYSGLTEADSLRRLSEDYPDDPRIWYELGENLYHAAPPFYGGFSGGLPEAERAFEQAVRLDSGAAHYHHHLVSLAFTLHHDSIRTAQRIAAHPGDQSVYERPFQLSMDLVYGSPSTRKRALQHLDTLSIEGVGDPLLVGIFEHMVRHPADGALQERVLRRLKRREDIDRNVHERFTTLWLAMNSFEQGQAREGLTLVREEPVDSTFAGCLPVWSETLGISVESDAFLRRHLDPSPFGEGRSLYPHMCRGIHLLEHGQFEEFRALLTRLRGADQKTGTDGLTVERALRELNGYRAWTAGNLRKAADLWSRSNPSFYWGAIWRGDLYRKLGRLEKAEGWYQAAWWHPVAHERLGRLYEEMGTPEKAQAAYERFVKAWKNADPELQHRVTEAREQLDVLGGKEPSE